MTTEAAPLPRSGGRRRWRMGGPLVAGVLVIAFWVGYLPRLRARAQLAVAARHHAALPALAVTPAVSEGPTRELRLPASLVAVNQALVFARASGYVRRWYVDIGAHVKGGDLLAELDTPELDQQLQQARASLSQKVAALKQAQANNQFLQVTARRQDVLYKEALVARQNADQADSQAAVGGATVVAAKADVAAQEAAVRQLEQLVAYGQVVAPFTGIITQRLIDVGSLVNAGAAQGGALFQIQAIDPLRVFIQVPQTYAPSVQVGVEAKMEIRQYTDRTFSGRVTRSAGALNPATRTLRTEIQVRNPSGELFPGMYANVTLPVAVSHPVVRIPSSAVIYDASGVHVAVVVDVSHVRLLPVEPGRDDGTHVEIVAGLEGGESVVVSPPAGLATGMQVQVAAVPAADGGVADGGRTDGG